MSLWLVGGIALITTFTSSYFNTGLESLVLVIWGPTDSAWVIAIYHAFFTIGGFLAPFLIQLFKSSDALKNCGGDTEEEDIPIASDNYWENMDLDIIPPYLIVGGFVAICGIFTMICAKKKLTEKLTSEKKNIVDTREEKPVLQLLLFFGFTMIIHACAANADTIFQSYIYYYTLCSETFYWEPEKANLMNIVFWGAFIVGRFSGTYIASKVQPWILIAIDFIGSIAGLAIIIGIDANDEANDILLYTGVVIFGYFVSCLYAASTSMCNSYTNMGLRYVFINNLGASVGTMIGPSVTGRYVEENPISFAYAVLTVCVIGLIAEIFVHLEGSRVLYKRSYKDTLLRKNPEEKPIDAPEE